MSLAGVDVDLWYVRLDTVTDPTLLDSYRRLLSQDELEQQQRFAFEKDRHRWLVTRALVRTTLSQYTGHSPRSWTFVRNEFGKPEVAEPAGLPLSFNVSHSGGLVTCAVAPGNQVGVDVEDTERKLEYVALAKRFFAPSEASAVGDPPPERRPAVFFQYWTLKEAYIKARGMGLSIPLSSFAFTLRGRLPPKIGFTPRCSDQPERWQFAQIQLLDRYQLALAVMLSKHHPMKIGFRQTIPLLRTEPRRILPANPSHQWTL